MLFALDKKVRERSAWWRKQFFVVEHGGLERSK